MNFIVLSIVLLRGCKDLPALLKCKQNGQFRSKTSSSYRPEIFVLCDYFVRQRSALRQRERFFLFGLFYLRIRRLKERDLTRKLD
jgi:hypothetical protein